MRLLLLLLLSLCTCPVVLAQVPTANAGPDRVALVNAPLSLDGTASTNAFDGLQSDGRHSIRWDFGYDGWNFQGNLTAPIAYPATGVHIVTLTVCNSSGTCVADQATVTVSNYTEGTETVLTDTGNSVTNMANLQAQIDGKVGTNNPVITLPVGFVASGTLFLKHRTVTNYMTIRTAGHASLPNERTRVSPADAVNMAILERTTSEMIIDTPAPSATPPRYYRFLGIHLRKNPATLNYFHTFVQIGQTGAASLAEMPDHIIFDRCYFDGGSTTSTTSRGLMIRASDFSLVNSYFHRFKGPGVEVQAVLTVSGERQAIINNFMEGSTENYMSGGTSPSVVDHVPTDIVFRRNYLKKDLGWMPSDPSYYGTNMVIKNLFELKLGKRYSIQGNIFETHWLEDQPGYGIVFTVRNDENNAPWSQISYVDFSHNKIINSNRALNIFGSSDLAPTLATHHVIVRHNVWTGINFGGGVSNSFILNDGPDGWDRVYIVNNTVDQNGDISFGHGRLILFESATKNRNLVFSANIGQGYINHNSGTGTTAFNTATAGSYSATKNGFYRSVGTNPADNTTVALIADVKFTDLAGGDLSLAVDSPFLTTGFNGGRSGADVTAMNTLTRGAVSGLWSGSIVVCDWHTDVCTP